VLAEKPRGSARLWWPQNVVVALCQLWCVVPRRAVSSNLLREQLCVYPLAGYRVGLAGSNPSVSCASLCCRNLVRVRVKARTMKSSPVPSAHANQVSNSTRLVGVPGWLRLSGAAALPGGTARSTRQPTLCRHAHDMRRQTFACLPSLC